MHNKSTLFTAIAFVFVNLVIEIDLAQAAQNPF